MIMVKLLIWLDSRGTGCDLIETFKIDFV